VRVEEVEVLVEDRVGESGGLGHRQPCKVDGATVAVCIIGRPPETRREYRLQIRSSREQLTREANSANHEAWIEIVHPGLSTDDNLVLPREVDQMHEPKTTSYAAPGGYPGRIRG